MKQKYLSVRIFSLFLAIILTSHALFFNVVTLASDSNSNIMEFYEEDGDSFETLEFLDEDGNPHATLEEALGSEVSDEYVEDDFESESEVSDEYFDNEPEPEVIEIEPYTELENGGIILTGQIYIIDYIVVGDIIVEGGTLYLINGGHITGTITITSGTFNMEGGTITGPGRGVYVTGENSTFNMTGGIITGNTAPGGGGVRIQNGASFNMSGTASIYNNESDSGGGVFLYHATFTMNGGSIRANHATTSGGGGGVRVNSSIFTMYDGSIRDNTASGAGGGVNLNSGSEDASYPTTFTMHGGIIEGNYSIGGSGGGGGGIRVWSGTFTMYDGIIRNNNTLFTLGGGGVSIRDSHFVMHSGSIDGNTTHDGDGGGVYLQTNEASFTAISGSIANNFSALDGGGIWTRANDYNRTLAPDAYHNLNISETIIFSGNRSGQGSYTPPTNWNITQIRGTGTSPETLEHQVHQLNNYDIGYRFDPETSTARINRDDLDMTIGESEQLRSTIIEEHPLLNTFMFRSITWSSSNTRIATVDQRGVVTSRGVGTVIITSRTTLNNGRVIITNSTVRVGPIRVTRITLNPTTINLGINATRRLTPTIAPVNATDRHVTWHSSNNQIATVSPNGTITTRRAGSVTITARTRDGNRTATARVNVGIVRVTGVTINGLAARGVNVGNHFNLTATIFPSNATNRGISWSSNNTRIATVNANGRVIGVSPGIAIITVRTNDGARTASIRVTVRANTLTVSKERWNPESNASNTRITVTSNTRWTVRSSVNWLTISNTLPSNRTGPGSFRINTTANTTASTRTGTITVTALGAPTRRITVNQQPRRILTLSGSIWEPSFGINTTTINVRSNARWSVTSNANWLRISNTTPALRIGNGSFRLTTTLHTGIFPRTGTITVTATGAPTRRITVTQQPTRRLTLSGNTWNPRHVTSRTTIDVTSNAQWRVVSDVNWLTISNATPANRTGNGSFRINATANTGNRNRAGTITVTAPGAPTRTIRVVQPFQPRLTLSTEAWNPRHVPSRTTINVTSNARWTVTSSVNWLTISHQTPASGTGDGSFRINATANTTARTRTGSIRVTAPGAPVRTIAVRQDPQPILTLSRSAWSPAATTDNTTINVTSNVQWTIRSNANWLSIANLTPANRTGNGSFRINATANTGNSRTGTITVTAPGAPTRTITVTQQGRPPIRVTGVSIVGTANRVLNIDNTLNLTATISPSNATNQGVTWSSSDSRIATVNSSGRVTAHRAGTATITVRTTDGGRTASVNVTVSSDTLTLSRSAWNPSRQGDNLIVSAHSNRLWTVRSSVGWMRVVAILGPGGDDNTQFRVSVDANTGGSTRVGVITVTAGTQTRTITVTQESYATIAQQRANDTRMRDNAQALMEHSLFNQDAWDNATPAERQDILINFYAHINALLDIRPRRNLEFRDFGARGPSGDYDRRTGQIRINTRYLQDSSGSDEMERRRGEAMRTVIHETRHEFQHQAIHDHNRFTVSLETREYWRRNMNNYIRRDPRSPSAHYAQPIEWDAFNFESPASGSRIRGTIRNGGRRPVHIGSWEWYD